MAAENAFTPGTGALSPSEHFSFTMGVGSPQSKDVLEVADEDGHDHHNEYVDHVNDAEEVLEFEGDELDKRSHQRFIVNNLENLTHQLFDIECNDSERYSQQKLEVGNRAHENSNTLTQKVKDDGNGNTNVCVLGIEDDDQMVAESQGPNAIVDRQSSVLQDKYCPPPAEGMEFESYDDAYNFYNCYAQELGFAIRVKSSWAKRNSKEKRGAVLCCNCEGFKTVKEASARRKETRTGCLAMIRLRLVESNSWRVDEVKLEHNHSFDPVRAQNSKSRKKIGAEVKRKSDPPMDVEVRTIKLYCTPAVDVGGCGTGTRISAGNEKVSEVQSNRLKLKEGDTQAIHDYFCQVQLANPNFLYLMDLNDEGQLRNVFWIDSKSRAAYGYFGDVVAIDTTCLLNNYGIPLLAFIGINHHAQSILLGCGLLADETLESFVWIFRAWLTTVLGRPPQTIITGQSKAIANAISEVFPRAHHCLGLQLVMQSIYHNLGPLQESETFQLLLNRTVYGSLKVDEFENSWECMVSRFGIKDLEWVQRLYEDREKWAPVYLKDTFLAGFAISQLAEPMIPFFSGYINDLTSLREFFDIYDSVTQKMHQRETLADLDLSESSSILRTSPSRRTGFSYDIQLSKLYTKSIFKKFQAEVETMSSCVSISQVQCSGPVTTYMIKERDSGNSAQDYRNFEVMYDQSSVEVRCMCGCFYLNGYLCRHALCVLNFNGVEEIPFSYILSRWRKDCERSYATDFGFVSKAIDVSNPVQRHENLCRKAVQVVEEGMVSKDHYMVAWQALKESLNKVRLAGVEKHV